MAIYDLFSKRKKRQESQDKSDVYQYDDIPAALRMQVAHIWRDAIGRYYRDSGYSFASDVEDSPASDIWEFIHNTIAREKGMGGLGDPNSTPPDRCFQYLMSADIDDALDIIELSFNVIDNSVRRLSPYAQRLAGIKQPPDSAIEELNQRFREHGLGYQYVNGQIQRIDSQFLHTDAVKPALELLNRSGFSGPAEEFMRAFDHHRKGNTKEAIAEALKAFESTMKAICDARRWGYPSKATAKPLLDIVFQKGLVPPGLESHFAGLRSAMESGLPTLANRTSRHGQGSTPIEIPPHFAAYALHLVASNIVFLIECHKARK